MVPERFYNSSPAQHGGNEINAKADLTIRLRLEAARQATRSGEFGNQS